MSDTTVERLSCPACGGPCNSNVRECPFCHNHLLALRCPDCAHLHFSGAKLCSQCGRSLRATPLGEATLAPCPRCRSPLHAVQIEQSPMHECSRCGGLFVGHDVLQQIVANRERMATFHLPIALDAPLNLHPPLYLKCPGCQSLMTPRNYGRSSGVIVDVCGKHGTWFDAGELTSALAWVARGGAAQALERERSELAERERVLRREQRALARGAGPAPSFVDADNKRADSLFVLVLQVLVDSLLD